VVPINLTMAELMASLKLGLIPIPLVFLCLVTGCTTCPGEEDKYTTFTNSFSNDVEVKFRIPDYDKPNTYIEFIETIPSNGTKKIFLYTLQFNTRSVAPTFKGNCGKDHFIKEFSTVQLSYDSLSQYTFCYSDSSGAENGYRIIPIANSCKENEHPTSLLGY